jgi:acetylornithine aminotransferase
MTNFLRDDDLSPAAQSQVLDLDAPVEAQGATVAREHGFIDNDCAPDRIRLAPPLILTTGQADELLAVWPDVLDEAYAAAGETS